MKDRVSGWSAGRTTAVYVAAALAWILVSTPLAFLTDDIGVLSPLAVEFGKGVLFVLVTGAALWAVTRRFERSLRAVEQERRELLQRNLEVAEAERDRLGRDLHDEAIQLLAAAAFRLEAAAEAAAGVDLEPARNLLRDGIGSLRRVVLELESPDMTVRSLEEYVAAYAERMLGPAEMEFDLTVDLPQTVEPEVLTATYRIVVEALSNVARHARAQHARVDITAREGVLSGRVTDDGRGIPGGHAPGPDHLGLRSMRERAERFGGRVTVGPAGGDGGTVVDFELGPVPRP